MAFHYDGSDAQYWHYESKDCDTDRTQHHLCMCKKGERRRWFEIVWC